MSHSWDKKSWKLSNNRGWLYATCLLTNNLFIHHILFVFPGGGGKGDWGLSDEELWFESSADFPH